MREQRLCLAQHEVSAGRRRDGLRTLAASRLSRSNWREYLKCLVLAAKPARR
jgi:hypothetical protein